MTGSRSSCLSRSTAVQSPEKFLSRRSLAAEGYRRTLIGPVTLRRTGSHSCYSGTFCRYLCPTRLADSGRRAIHCASSWECPNSNITNAIPSSASLREASLALPLFD